MADTNTRQGKRTPVTLKIKFKSETLEQFIERYAVDVSQGGIFIRTKDPLAVGTQMKFEFQLRDASPLIAGEGTVVWTRENDPSRPAIAPGMGVRFDRLADGSQTVLEKILAEKAKQAPSRSGTSTAPGDSAKAAMFTDTPTRVAPMAMQEALGVRGGRADSEQTPLPKPRPFHSDADEFDDRAFEEATKVRSLDELVAENAALGDQLSEDARTSTKIMPADELAVRRHAGRADSTISDPPLASPPPESHVPYSMPDRDSAPGLPSPPVVAPRTDPTPPRPRPPTNPGMGPAQPSGALSAAPQTEARTQLGLGATKSSQSSMPRTPPPESAAPRAAMANETSRPIAPSRPSSAPIIIGILLVVGAAIGAVYWFVLREPGAPKEVVTTPGSGSAVTTAGSGSAGSAAAMTGSASGSAVAMGSNSGSAAGSGSAATMAGSNAGPTVDTVITAAAKGATIEIVGTEIKGPSPLTAKLEKDKPYKARVTAAGFTVSEIDVKGGEPTTAKLVLKPRVIDVTTNPPGASIYVDNVDTGKLSPSEITLTAAQASRPRVRISLRRSGFRPVDKVVDATLFKDEGGTMTNSVEAKLVVQQVVRPPPGGGTTGTGSGSATPAGTGSGSATPTGNGTGSGSTATPPTGTGTGSATTAPKPPEPTMSPGAGTMPTDLK